MRVDFTGKRISYEEVLDHPAKYLDEDLDADRYSAEEYGFLLGYYGEGEEEK